MTGQTSSALRILAGPRAMQRLRSHGMQAQDVAVIPAAAGGPKGLILNPLDQWLFGEWLPTAGTRKPVSLIGASIGSWRMAAACMPDARAGLSQFAEMYCGQRYRLRPTPQEVTEHVQHMLRDWLQGQEEAILKHPWLRLHILAVRGKRRLQDAAQAGAQRAGFVAAALANLRRRAGLGEHLQRVLISDPRDALTWLKAGTENGQFDSFGTDYVPLRADNLQLSLRASGTLPLIMQPVHNLPHAAPGLYWDGGLIDYHLAWPYANLGQDELVLYPHFEDRIIPGWFDKTLPWRRTLPAGHRHWLENVIVLCPSPGFIASLPRAKLPDRADFNYYRQEHAARSAAWFKAIGEAQRLRDAFAEFVARPDLSRVEAL